MVLTRSFILKSCVESHQSFQNFYCGAMVRHFLSNSFIKKNKKQTFFSSLLLSPLSSDIPVFSFSPPLPRGGSDRWMFILSLHLFSKLPYFPLKTQRIKSRFFSQAFTSAPTCDSICIDIAL